MVPLLSRLQVSQENHLVVRGESASVRVRSFCAWDSSRGYFEPDSTAYRCYFLTRKYPGAPPLFSTSEHDEDRGPEFQAHKAAFFFKLERELEKINAFYLQKEAELKLRLETLLSKRRAAAMRGLPDTVDGTMQNHVEWNAVEEGFRLIERDLGKLQVQLLPVVSPMDLWRS
ncbi:hypothetical protein BT96DRAFT_293900 [Gymnopus androsaceus JB14]|uniref:SPX domain-containing protein n=1 Tax=Gymnopus androsaceus JB14 TaxID=1447944 RepID=A0A6A4I7N6_9AGAR|nr:hypothetical protein BT96DRAFT_293900 [Gymnopus androsaceus JB14]